MGAGVQGLGHPLMLEQKWSTPYTMLVAQAAHLLTVPQHGPCNAQFQLELFDCVEPAINRMQQFLVRDIRFVSLFLEYCALELNELFSFSLLFSFI